MLFFGHIAASLLIADATDTDRAAAVAGTLLPDVIDKSVHRFGRVPSRWVAHGLPFFVLTVLGTRSAMSQKHWRAFALGYTGHLLCDLWGGSKVPWFAPFESHRRAKRNRWPSSLRKWVIYFIPEVAGASIVWRLLRPDSGAQSQ